MARFPDIGSMTGSASVAFTLKPGDISGPLDSGKYRRGAERFLKSSNPLTQGFCNQERTRFAIHFCQAKQGELFGIFVSNLRETDGKSQKKRSRSIRMK